MAKQSYSIVEYYAEHEGYECGYCKSPDTNFSHGMWAHSLTVQDYQSLIDRGWRRSGCYCYKPIMNQICCPQYTIRCEALDFKISKSQKKILKRMMKFLKNELTKDNVSAVSEDQQDNIDEEVSNYAKYLTKAEKNASQINVSSVDDELSGKLSVNLIKSKSQINSTSASRNSQKQMINSDSRSNLHVRSEITNVVLCKKAKLLRLERKQNKLLAQGKSQSEIESIMKERKQQNYIKSLEELFDEVYTGLKKLELKLVRTAPMSSEYLKTSKKSYEVYKKYQMMIHGDQAEEITEQQYTRFLVKSPLQMKLVKVMSDEFLNTFDASANLYKKYQMAIHNDPPEECNQKSFFNFLVKSPLQQWTPNSGPSQGYGSFHEQYWLDNELIAVGVIDILPSCISSVYFFYDPTYSQLSLGTFSSLREIYLTRQLNKVASDLKYYYMGFYIHTCPKMQYKAKMRPSKLLCPQTYVWCDIDPCLIKLDNEKYSRLNDDSNAIDKDGVIDVEEVLILYKRIAMPYKKYKEQQKTCQTTREEKRKIEEYASLVGMPCARRMLLYRYSEENVH
ncbi:arginyl-tRNA--protein transferase 1 isoform X2 [Cataglyphis hispanica]|uniref:arginyl-tRNA--protein transferase 1 isoform X2 n=1 Tax=Cataglyphis hispanica TaxID=1086592 RepID=UPI00217F82FF|nr:arginyl-tRNA--protein transferase 1 isoform X2 [Cataglyphis hispanica]